MRALRMRMALLGIVYYKMQQRIAKIVLVLLLGNSALAPIPS